MCDYSLCGIPNRLAVEGEQLVVHRFFTHSMGLASPNELRAVEAKLAAKENQGLWSRFKSWFSLDVIEQAPAVCIPPGARLMLREIPEQLRQELDVGEEEEVTFIQMTTDAYRHRDGVRFKNGREISLQRLQENEPVDVLSLSPADAEVVLKDGLEAIARNQTVERR